MVVEKFEPDGLACPRPAPEHMGSQKRERIAAIQRYEIRRLKALKRLHVPADPVGGSEQFTEHTNLVMALQEIDEQG
jgi:hypothetical protein